MQRGTGLVGDPSGGQAATQAAMKAAIAGWNALTTAQKQTWVDRLAGYEGVSIGGSGYENGENWHRALYVMYRLGDQSPRVTAPSGAAPGKARTCTNFRWSPGSGKYFTAGEGDGLSMSNRRVEVYVQGPNPHEWTPLNPAHFHKFNPAGAGNQFGVFGPVTSWSKFGRVANGTYPVGSWVYIRVWLLSPFGVIGRPADFQRQVTT